MADVLWRWNTTTPPAAPIYNTATADEASPPDPDAVIIEDKRVTLGPITATSIDVGTSGDVNAGAINADQDQEFLQNGIGTIVRDKTTGTRYRIIVDNGVLKKEAV